MLNGLRRQFSKLLVYLAESLDISDSAYQRTEGRYQSVGTWLGRRGSRVAEFEPNIYAQGSFRLGTVIRPISDSEEYDVDLVCELNLGKNQVTQKRLKELTGDEIKSYVSSNGITTPLEEGKRCWKLNYADSAQFHMDILPAIPDGESFRTLLILRGYSNKWAAHAIAITDKTLPNYARIDNDWPRSNPKGYSEWFKDRMRARFEVAKAMLAESLKVNIETIPDYKVKAPLQQAVQLLKRHRDIMFEGDQENKPISIIITTLAALAYDNEPELLDALDGIVRRMGSHITQNGSVSWVGNPVNPLENFAERWQGHPEKKQALDRWLLQLRTDLDNALRATSVQAFGESLKPKVGERIVDEALKHFPGMNTGKVTQTSETGRTPNQFDVSHRQKPLWPLRAAYSLSLSGQIGIENRWHKFNSNCAPLPKHCSLVFSAETNAPSPFSVFWQVVNTGKEARESNGLRGSIFPSGTAGLGGLKQKESTLYTGMHWIECFVVKNGVCVARSGEFVVNIE